MGACVSVKNDEIYDPIEFYDDFSEICSCDYSGVHVDIYVPETGDWVCMSKAYHCPIHQREHYYC